MLLIVADEYKDRNLYKDIFIGSKTKKRIQKEHYERIIQIFDILIRSRTIVSIIQ